MRLFVKNNPHFWRSGRDSNPREISLKLISSQPRYDHFDTAAYSLDFFPSETGKG